MPVLVAAGGAGWEAHVVAALERRSSPVTVARRCVDVVDLLAVAASGQGRAALVDAGLRRLDADAVDRLLAAEVVPVGVVQRDDTAAVERLRAMGVAEVVPADADPSVIASVLVAAVEHAARPELRHRTARSFGDPATSMTVPASIPDESVPGDDDVPDRHGTVVAVWGPTGAPGRTTVAIALADEIARLDRHVLLVDADVYGGTVAAMLGLLDETPGLAAACRHAGSARLDTASLSALCWQLRPSLRVLTGVPLAARWPEVRPAALGAVLAAARQLADVVVVDCGFCLETDEELSFDSLAPRRNGATLAVLDDADRIVAVGAADPIGVQRIVRGLGELADLELSAPVEVVLTKVRRGVVPGDVDAELTGALELFAGRRPAALLPYDREALDAAVAIGRTLGEARPSSPLRRALARYAAGVVGVPAPAGRRR